MPRLKLMQTTTALLLAVLVSGCASSSSGRSSRDQIEADRAKAADINLQLAIGYLEEGRLEVALEKINRAAALNPKSASVHSVAGIINENIGRFEEAGQHYERSVKLNPENGDLANNYGQFLCKSGDTTKAAEYFARAVEDPFYETPEVALGNACFCYFKSGEYTKAEPFCRQTIETDETLPDPYFLLARMFQEQGNSFRARAFLQRYESIGPDTPASLELCIAIETALGDSAAVADCEKRLKDNFPDAGKARDQEGRTSDGSAVEQQQ